MTRVLRALLAVVAALGVSSCQAVARVTVAERSAGDGTVSVGLSLDKSAAAQFPNLGQQLRLDDLRRAGWTVIGPTTAPSGAETVSVTRAFRDPKGAQALLAQVAGPTGPLRGLRLEHHRSVFTTRSALVGTVDLAGGADLFGDPHLAQQLGVPSLSSALATFRDHGGADPGLRLELDAQLPGRTAVWTASLGQTVAVSARARELNRVNIALAILAALCLLALAAVGLRRSGLGVGRGRRRDSWTIAQPSRRRR